jgi:nucleoside-diphosphate-sugar epimerase
MERKKAVITGGAGFIGSHLADALLARGYSVCIVDNLSTGRIENIGHIMDNIEFVKGSILDETILDHAFSGASYVFHLAAVPSVPKSIQDPLTSHEANATGTLKVLIAARAAKVQRVIYAASSSFYGDTPTLPKHEDMPAQPLSPYALQKYSGEAYMEQFYKLYGMETISLRYFNIYGPRQDPSSEYSAVIPRFIKMMKHGERPTIYGDGTNSRGFTYVSDAVAANMLAIEAPGVAGHVFNVSGGTRTTLDELVAAINHELGTSIEPIHGVPRAGDISHSHADVSKAGAMLGFVPVVSLAEGLKKTAATIQ